MENILILSLAGLCIIAAANLFFLLILAHKAVHADLARKQAEAGSRQGLPAGTTAPDFIAVDGRGREVAGASFNGKARMIVVISTVCGVCKELLPLFHQAWAGAGANGVEFILLTDDGVEQTRALVRDYRVEIPVYALGAQTFEFMQRYNLKDFPRYCYVNAANRVEHAGYPSLIDENWRRLFESWTSREGLQTAA